MHRKFFIIEDRGEILPGESCFAIVGARVYSSYGKQVALEIDEIIEKTKLSAAKAVSCLSILGIKGKIRNLEGNTYALRR